MATLTPEQYADQIESAGPKLGRILRQRGIAVALRMESKSKEYATDRMNTPTGTLLRSIAGRVEGGQGSRPLDIVASAGGRSGGRDVPYARIQDQGGVIRPKKARWLAVPHDSVKTPAGASRYASPRMYPADLRFQHIFFGLAALVEDTASGPEVRWWLLKKVTIRPKRYLEDAWRETAATVPSVFADAFEVAMQPRVGV